MAFPFTDDLRTKVAVNLQAFDPVAVDDDGLRHAAVAIVIVAHPRTGDAGILLTLRPLNLKRHGGQYALPGGRLDDGETPEAAALRELDEELRVTLGEADLLGNLDDYPTRSGFRISPIVMWGGTVGTINPDPGEVERVLHIPLDQLNGPGIPRLSEPGPDGRQVLSALLPAIGHEMFAPTAAMLDQFREVALNARPTRVAHYDQPQFAWR